MEADIEIPTPDEVLEMNRGRFGAEIEEVVQNAVKVLRESFLAEDMEVSVAVEVSNPAVLAAVSKRFERRGWAAWQWMDEESGQYYMTFGKAQMAEEEEEEEEEDDDDDEDDDEGDEEEEPG